MIAGKTNVHFMLADFAQTANDVYGVTRNPWDPSLTPGGSTGGGAAALAAGMTFLEYGSDLIGSIRIPAGFCGVYGLRPTSGIVPMAGFQPPGPDPDPSEMLYMSALGPLARSPRDLRTALAATAGPDEPAARACSWRLPAPRRTRLSDFRIGVVLDDERVPVAAEVGSVLSDAVDALARAGANITEGWPAGIDPQRCYDSFGHHVRLFFAYQQPGEEPPSGRELIEQERYRMAVRAAWGRWFEEHDVFLCPTNFTTAFPHDTRPFPERTIATGAGERRYDEQPFWTAHASLPGLPALSAPAGRTAAGLPVGVQVIAPRYEDDTALTFAELLAPVVGGYEPPPV